jgi:DNA replication and repair protein RecF
VSNLDRDLFRGFTSAGPHRDDLLLELNGTDVRTYGSQGQQRTTALSLKLSEIALIERLRQEKPVLLLDDVFSELDEGRRSLLLSAIDGCQGLITCTHLSELGPGQDQPLQVFRAGNGRLIEV